MAKIGYLRVSSTDQNLDRQEIALKELGVEKYFMEKASGKNTDREEFKKMLDYVREGDTLYIESISRLARSTRDLLNIVQTLQEKKVELISLKENIDTSTPQGRFIIAVFAALSELEREGILQRQKEGIAAAKLKGKKLGRPKVELSKDFELIYKKWKQEEITAVEAMKKLKLKKSTFYELVRQYEKTSLNGGAL